MSLSEDAQRAAERSTSKAKKVAAAATTKYRRQIAAWVEARTGVATTWVGDNDLAVGLFDPDGKPFVTERSYPIFQVDDVALAYEKRDGKSLHLVCSSDDGDFLGPRVHTVISADWTKPQKRKRLVEGLAQAMAAEPKHPAAIIRDMDAACPTCGRPW